MSLSCFNKPRIQQCAPSCHSYVKKLCKKYILKLVVQCVEICIHSSALHSHSCRSIWKVFFFDDLSWSKSSYGSWVKYYQTFFSLASSYLRLSLIIFATFSAGIWQRKLPLKSKTWSCLKFFSKIVMSDTFYIK